MFRITRNHQHPSLLYCAFMPKRGVLHRELWYLSIIVFQRVLTCHLSHSQFPPWTSYFVKYKNIVDDQRGKSHFNWTVQEGQNYHILRTGCYPYIKYHCTRRPYEDLSIDDNFFRVIKLINLGIPCLAYGIAAMYLIKHTEIVPTSKGPVTIYFLYEEDKGSRF